MEAGSGGHSFVFLLRHWTEINRDGFEHDVFKVVTVRNQCAYLLGILLRVPTLERKSEVGIFFFVGKSAAKIKVGFFHRPHDAKWPARTEEEILGSLLQHILRFCALFNFSCAFDKVCIRPLDFVPAEAA